MRVVMFYHSLISDWNHGNAHFLRGIATDLLSRGHEVAIYEPEDAWSASNLIQDHGYEPIEEFRIFYPSLSSERYDLRSFDLDRALEGADLVLVHEWNSPELVAALGERRGRDGNFRLLFHDTHHRIMTAFEEMSRFDLRHYDGVLAFGKVIADLYREKALAREAWTWHEAADTRVFRPLLVGAREGDLVWVGNWGDDERTEELREFLIDPALELKLSVRMHGVRYPKQAREELRAAGIDYQGWVANFRVPSLFSSFRFTVHVPRRPYVEALPGIPTIRVFEALACGIPLISAPWEDSEGLFKPGRDFLVARTGREMREHMAAVMNDRQLSRSLRESGIRTIQERHTCTHRVDELLRIRDELSGGKKCVA